MTAANKVETPAWIAEFVRFTAFPPPSVAFEPTPVWHRIVGQAPEDIQERPQQMLRNEFGSFQDAHLFITQQPSRIDIVFGLHPEKVSPEVPASVGPYALASKNLSPIIEAWLKIAPTVGWMAYAPSVAVQVASHEDGYEFFKKLLPKLPIDPINSRNFLWQINRPRRSSIWEGQTINRVSKWSLSRLERVQVTLTGGEARLASGAAASFYGKLELDIFTEPPRPIPAENLAPMFGELRTMAEELMHSGDIP